MSADLYRQANGADAPVAHTPGEWQVWTEEKARRDDIFVVGNPDGAVGGMRNIAFIIPTLVAGQKEANAALMCAAPSLLAALQACLCCMESDLPPEVTEAERLAAAAAIALAIGGAS